LQGVYRAYYDKEGREVHELVAPLEPKDINARDLSDILPVSTNPLSKRGQRIYCGCGFNMNENDCNIAVNNLENQFGGNGIVGPYLSWYAIAGSVVAFFCNYSGDYYEISSSVYADILAAITDACGQYIAGSYGSPSTDGVGYMRYYDGLNFCANALTSSSSSC
jgi:hypothetical protein